MARSWKDYGSLLCGFKMRGARDIVTLEVNSEETIANFVRGAFVCKASDLAKIGADSADLTFVGICVAKPRYRNGVYYVKVFTKGRFKMTAVSIANNMEGANMYIKTATTFDDTLGVTNHVKVGTLLERISNTKGWIDLGASA